MKTKISTQEIVDLIVNDVDIRGIELVYYRNSFESVAEKILKLIDEGNTSYYNSEKNEMIELEK